MEKDMRDDGPGIADADLETHAGLGADGIAAFREQLVSRIPIAPGPACSIDRAEGLALALEYKALRSGPGRFLGVSGRVSPVEGLADVMAARRRREAGASVPDLVPPNLSAILDGSSGTEQTVLVATMEEMFELAGRGRSDVLDHVFANADPGMLDVRMQMTLLRGAFSLRSGLPSWAGFRDRCEVWMVANGFVADKLLNGLKPRVSEAGVGVAHPFP